MGLLVVMVVMMLVGGDDVGWWLVSGEFPLNEDVPSCWKLHSGHFYHKCQLL